MLYPIKIQLTTKFSDADHHAHAGQHEQPVLEFLDAMATNWQQGRDGSRYCGPLAFLPRLSSSLSSTYIPPQNLQYLPITYYVGGDPLRGSDPGGPM